jgi:predicted KAP-like P-loop ATPase
MDEPSQTVGTFRPVANSDRPTTIDDLGFGPYVAAVAAFLTNDDTEPPLTISIEGVWGAGKSSFIEQLASILTTAQASNSSSKYRFVRFSAWRHQKSEELWAAFAMTFMRELRLSLPGPLRPYAALKLAASRL